MVVLVLVLIVESQTAAVRKYSSEILTTLLAADTEDTKAAMTLVLARKLQPTAVKLLLPLLSDVFFQVRCVTCLSTNAVSLRQFH